VTPLDQPDNHKKDLVYYVVKTPPGIKNRDFLLERKVKDISK
jgi:hypothetical protein